MNLYDLLKWFAEPLVKVALALSSFLAVVLGAMADPAGAVNSFMVRLIDWTAIYWPETPQGMQIATLITQAIDPSSVGGAVVLEIASTASLMLSVVLLIKLYKLIPFKAT